MLSTSREFDVDHVEFIDGSVLDGNVLRGVLDITNSKCNLYRNETKEKIRNLKKEISFFFLITKIHGKCWST